MANAGGTRRNRGSRPGVEVDEVQRGTPVAPRFGSVDARDMPSYLDTTSTLAVLEHRFVDAVRRTCV